MRKSTLFLSGLLASTVFIAACESRGPGDIGSLDDIVIRNAGEPPIEAALSAPSTAEAEIDPVIAAHEKAVEDAEPEIDEQAKGDMDDTPVPGEPAEEVIAEEDVVEETPAEVVEPVMSEEEVPPASEDLAQDILDSPIDPVVEAEPMQGQEMDVIEAMEGQTMAEPAPDIIEEPIQEEAIIQEPIAAPAPVSKEEVPVERVVESEPAPAPAPTEKIYAGIIENLDTHAIMAVQTALSDKGYYFGATDGVMGTELLNALYLYQSAHRMEVFGLTYETLGKLGVVYNKAQ